MTAILRTDFSTMRRVRVVLSASLSITNPGTGKRVTWVVGQSLSSDLQAECSSESRPLPYHVGPPGSS